MPPSRPVLIVRRNSVTRSTRCSARPQLWAMSVALLAQGDTVPRRGITTTMAVPAVGGGAFVRVAVAQQAGQLAGGSSGWTTVSRPDPVDVARGTPVMRDETDCSFGNSAWARKADRALPPSKCSRCFCVGDMRCGLASGEESGIGRASWAVAGANLT